jgi:DNA invertase Pin-like site-specific DNA recombinase
MDKEVLMAHDVAHAARATGSVAAAPAALALRGEAPAELGGEPAGGAPAVEDGRVRAAQYVRMSTDHQQYSTTNQREAIANYAAEHGMVVVRTYADEGKSGLTLEGRAALQALLYDVSCGRADYQVVLIYDVSRWGRFQDSDESAYHEYLCRRAGIHVEYCMEPFRNDGTPMSAVMKGLKRVMAAEYSRELSEKVFTAKCLISRMGYRQGGSAGYGLRRMMVDENGTPRGVLELGQQKFLQTDRIVLVPGPPEELEVLRWMFLQVARHGKTPTHIAEELNEMGVPSEGGRHWTTFRVRNMLMNEKYIGNLVFNRSSVRLKTPVVSNPPEKWIRVEGAFPPAVDPVLFRDAQIVMSRWSRRVTNESAICSLKALLEEHGHLSGEVIDSAGEGPGSYFYDNRFGGLMKAYALAGFEPSRSYKFLKGYGDRLRWVTAWRENIVEQLRERGVAVRRASKAMFILSGGIRVAIMFGYCKPVQGKPRWLIQLHMKPRPHWVLIANLRADEVAAQEYWLVAGGVGALLFGGEVHSTRERHRSDDVRPLLDMLATRAAEATERKRSARRRRARDDDRTSDRTKSPGQSRGSKQRRRSGGATRAAGRRSRATPPGARATRSSRPGRRPRPPGTPA